MFSVNDLILTVGENFTPFDERLKSSYLKEFSTYSETRLEKVWESIQQHHTFSKAPELGQIFKYMNLSDVSRYKPQGNSYLVCQTCGTNYSINSCLCPKCNKNKKLGEYVHNEVKVKIADRFPDNFMFTRPGCAICPIYRQKIVDPKGIGCLAWNTDLDKSGFNCDKCICFRCCIDKPDKDPDMPVGHLMAEIKKNATPGNDPAWLNFYKKYEIKPGLVILCCGKDFRNKTGKVLAASPWSDLENWERYTVKVEQIKPKIVFNSFKGDDTATV